MSPPTWIPGVGYALQIAVAIMAAAIARRRRFHWPFAAYALALAMGDVIHAGVLLLLRPYSTPYVGAGRTLFHVTEALTILPPIALLAAACAMLPEPGHVSTARVETKSAACRAVQSIERCGLVPHVVGAGFALVAVLAVAYPWLARERLQTAYMVIHGLCQVATWAAVVAIVRARDFALLPSYALLIATLSADLVVWAGPFAGDMFADWHTVIGVYLTLQVSTCVTHAAWLYSLRRAR